MIRKLTPFFCLALVLGVVCDMVFGAPYDDPDRRTPVVRAIEKASPSVVNISTTKLVARTDPFMDWFGRYERPRAYPVKSVGSGVIVHPDGYVVTNSHVVRRATEVVVSLDFGGEEKQYQCTVLDDDPKNDLALLKMDSDGPFPAATLGRSDTLMIGEPAIAVGNPFGVGKTVTTGVISALGRTVNVAQGVSFKDFIQTDAQINPGNSGGALVNIRGEMIGVNSAIIVNRGQRGDGIGFAIPVDRVKEILPRLLEGAVRRANLGFRPVVEEKGVTVRSVVPDGASAAMKAGDLIKMVDGRPVNSVFDFATVLLKKKPGDLIHVSTLRGEDRVRVNIVVPLTSEAEYVAQRMGFVGGELSASLRTRGLTGVLVKKILPDSPAARIKLQEGDLVVRLDRYSIGSMQDLAGHLQRARSGRNVDIEVRRGRRNLAGSITLR